MSRFGYSGEPRFENREETGKELVRYHEQQGCAGKTMTNRFIAPVVLKYLRQEGRTAKDADSRVPGQFLFGHSIGPEKPR